ILIALIGVAGAVIGSVATTVGQVALYCFRQRATAAQNEARKSLLREMLENPKHQWRRLETLMHVIGADERTTKDLLLQIDARASEDGQPLWGLKKRNPLPNEQ